MKYNIIEYNFNVKKGDKLKTLDGRIREVDSTDGRFIKFTDGTLYSLNHPDIVGIAVEIKKNQKEGK